MSNKSRTKNKHFTILEKEVRENNDKEIVENKKIKRGENFFKKILGGRSRRDMGRGRRLVKRKMTNISYCSLLLSDNYF